MVLARPDADELRGVEVGERLAVQRLVRGVPPALLEILAVRGVLGGAEDVVDDVDDVRDEVLDALHVLLDLHEGLLDEGRERVGVPEGGEGRLELRGVEDQVVQVHADRQVGLLLDVQLLEVL